jgi:hypothetical protein
VNILLPHRTCSASVALILFSFHVLPYSAARASEAEGCPTVRLDRNGGPFEKIPVYNQFEEDGSTDAGLCYAIGAAQLIDAYRMRVAGKADIPLTAPVSVALNFSALNYEPEEDIELPKDKGKIGVALIGAGTPEDAILASSNKPLCDQRWFEKFDALTSSTKSPRGPRKDAKAPSTRNLVRAIFEQIEKWKAVREQLARATTPLRKPQKSDDLCTDILNPYFTSRSINNENLGDITAAVNAALDRDNPVLKLQKVVDWLCRSHHHRASIPNPIVFYPERDWKLEGHITQLKNEWQAEASRLGLTRRDSAKKFSKRMVELDEEIDKLRNKDSARHNSAIIGKVNELFSKSPAIPFAIDYDVSVLEGNKISIDTRTIDHTSVVVGQEFDAGMKTCNLLVRNSYGTNCRKPNGKSKYAFPCTNGTIAVPRTELARATRWLTWIP